MGVVAADKASGGAAMPKVDRATELKKQAAKTTKKVAADSKKALKEAAKETEEAEIDEGTQASPSNGSKSSKLKAGAPPGTFGKAAAALMAERDEDEDEDEQETDNYARAEAKVPAKQETKAERKAKQAKQKAGEMDLLLTEEKEARKQRVKDRLLRFLVVGAVMDAMQDRTASTNGNGSAHAKKNSGKKQKEKSSKSLSESYNDMRGKVEIFSAPALMLVFVFAIFAARFMEEGYHPDGRADGEVDYYTVMGVPRDASNMDIRKKYKALALSWHPDKNPDCEACPEKFAKISKAYETLSNPEDRQAYDKRKTSASSVKSQYSVDLTVEDFEDKVLRSNEVWVVQVFDPSDPGTTNFAPMWEDVASQLQNVARFGRLNAVAQKAALEFMPQRVVIMPTVFRFARGETTENFLWGRVEERGSSPLSRWVVDGYPEIPRISEAAELKRWWSGSRRAKLMVAGPGSAIRRGSSQTAFFQVLRAGHLWAEFFDVVAADSKVAAEVLGSDFAPPGDGKWSVLTRPAALGSKAEMSSTSDLKEVPALMEEVIEKAVSGSAPHLTVRNHRQLCEARNDRRTYCLVLVDATDAAADKALAELNESRISYAQEIAELKEAGEESVEEPFHVQAVRVMTSSSRLPWMPVAAGPSFKSLWAEVGRSKAFVMELDTQRVTAVKTPSMTNLFQAIGYDDLKFQDLSEKEGISLTRSLPDPEVPLRREIRRVLTSPVGAIFTYLLIAVVASVAPEVSLVVNCAVLGSALALVVVCWPIACRRCIAFLTFSG